MMAARGGKPDVVRVLIGARADVNARNRWASTALHVAASAMVKQNNRLNKLETICLLLKAQADANARDSHGVTPLIEAARSGSVVAIELLLARGVNPSFCDLQGLSAADYLVRVRTYAGASSACRGPECDALIAILQGEPPR